MADFYSPFRGNQLMDQVTNLMMLKKQQEQQEKQREQEAKDQLNRIEQQHKLDKLLYTAKLEADKKNREQQFQSMAEQTMRQFQQYGGPALRQGLIDRSVSASFPPGQEPLKPGGEETYGAAGYGAAMGEPLPAQQALSNLNRAQGYQINPEDLFRYKQVMDAANVRAQTSQAANQLNNETNRYRANVGAQTSLANTATRAGTSQANAGLRAQTSLANNQLNNKTRLTISDLNRAAVKPPPWLARAPITIRQMYESKKIEIEKMRQASLDEAKWSNNDGTPEQIAAIKDVNDKYDAMLLSLKDGLTDAYTKSIQNTGNNPVNVLNGTMNKPSSVPLPSGIPSADNVMKRFKF